VGGERPLPRRPATLGKLRRESIRERRQASCALADLEEYSPGPRRRRKGAGARKARLERRRIPRRPVHGGLERRDRGRRRRTEEPECEVQVRRADPAQPRGRRRGGIRVATAVGWCAEIGHQASHSLARIVAERDGDEEAPLAGRERADPAFGTAPGHRACSRPHVARSSRSTSSARSRSRQPTTSVSFFSRSLYVWKKCSISTSRCGRTCCRRLMCAWCGPPSATHRTLKSKP